MVDTSSRIDNYYDYVNTGIIKDNNNIAKNLNVNVGIKKS